MIVDTECGWFEIQYKILGLSRDSWPPVMLLDIDTVDKSGDNGVPPPDERHFQTTSARVVSIDR